MLARRARLHVLPAGTTNRESVLWEDQPELSMQFTQGFVAYRPP